MIVCPLPDAIDSNQWRTLREAKKPSNNKGQDTNPGGTVGCLTAINGTPVRMAYAG